MTITKKILEESINEVSAKVNSAVLNTLAQRKLGTKGYSFSRFPVEEQIKKGDKVWKSETSFWVKNQAFSYCEKLLKKPDDLVLGWPTIKDGQNNVDSWRTSDGLSKVFPEYWKLSQIWFYQY